MCFYYVASGMYCGGSEFKYPETIDKNECSIMLEICPTPNPNLNLLDSVDKCKTDITMNLLMQPCYLNLYADLNCFVRALHLSSMSLYSVSYQINLPSMKTHRYQAGYV